MTMFTKRCCQLIKIGQQSFATGTRTLLMLLLLSSFLLPAGSFGQIAPFAGGSFTPAPTNGFNIDGSLRRLNTSYGDWLMGIGAGLNTPGTFVLSDAGTPLYPLTFHVVDPQNSDLDDAFDGGEKVFHDPNTWAWTTKKQLGKDDINNSLIHIAQDPAGDYWAMLAGDRRTTEGTSYIDFEFLQNTLTKDADGGFTSAGPNGGRTIGDILITVEYTNGGIVANILYYRWQSVGEGTFDYVQFTPPNTQAFGSVNQVPIPVPYGAFGSNTYDALQFVEVAINFSQLIRGSLGLDPCQALSFKTLFIKTKSSDARTADLKDLIEPIQINLNLGVQNISYAGPFCDGPGSASPTIDNPNNLPAGTFSGSAGLVINSTTGVIDLGATPPGTYTVTYTYQPRPNCIRQATTQVVINPPATANAGADQTVCASSPAVTLAGSVGGSATSGTWSGGTGTFNPNATTLNATYTPSAAEIAAGTVTLTLTTNDPAGPCGSANDAMTITINPAATANAGADQTVCASSPAVTLAGSVGGGATSGTWSGGTGTFNPNASTLNAVYTPSAAEIAAGTVTLTLTSNNPDGPCNAATDQMTITINPAATANAGADQTVCASSPNVTLAGSVGGGATSGTWSGGTGTFNPNASTLNAVYTPSAAEIAAGTVTLTLTTNNPAGPCDAATDQMTITINPAATANAGADQTVCATSPNVTLAGSVGGGATSGTWSGGTGTFNPNATTLNAVYTPSAAEITAGTVTLTLTSNNPDGPCNAATDQMTITINPAATANAGADQTVCATSPNVTLAGSVGGGATSGTWSGGTGTFNPNATTLNAVYTPSAAEIAAGTVTLTLTSNNPDGPCNAATDQMTITINPAATANAGADQTVCAASPAVVLAGSVGGGATSGTWSGGTGTFNPNASTLNATYTPSAAEIAAGTVTLTLTSNNPEGPCNAATDQMTITISGTASANAGADQTVCASSPNVTLAGSVGGGATSGTWSGGTGTFNPNASTLNAVYTPSAAEIAAGTVTLTLTTNDPAGPCNAATDQMTITINPIATANAGADQTVCATSPTVTLAGSVGGAATSGTWSGGTGTFNPDATTLNATYTPSAAEIAAGTVTLTLTSNNPAGPCNAATDQMTITINPAATANAGADQSVCATSPNVTLAGSVGGGATSGTWSGGTGTFNPNATTLNAVYTPSAAEIAAGTVTLTLTTNNPDGPCNAATDQMTITISPAATANAGADQTICAGLTVQLAGSVGGSATSGTWSGGTGTFNPNASTLNAVYTPSAAEIAAGSVTLTLTTNDPAGACGTATDQVTITITPCGGDTYCTYTQGQYGTEGGMACIGDALLSTYDLINHALDNLPGDQLYIGKPGRSFLISRNADNINAVIGFLPGGGKSVILSGNILATAVPGTMLKNGALNNTLLAQTITLGLNLGVKSNLASFELESGQWLVTQGNADCSEESEVVPCDYDSVKFAANVVTFLQNHVLDINNEFVPDLSLDKEATVLELFHLASNMLGGRTYAGITLDNVAKIADDINNIFDGCRTSLGYTDTPPHCPELIITESGIESAAERITTPGNERGRLDAGTLQVTVNPNPIRTSLNIRIKSPVSGNASVEVFNAMGQKIYQTNRYVVANVLTTVTYGDVTKDGMLLYRVRVGKHSATGKAIKP